jgi:hypothetical protein
VPDDDRRSQLRFLDGAVHDVCDALEVVARPGGRSTVAWKVQGEDQPPSVDRAHLGQRWAPHGAIEGQAMQKNEWRAMIELAVEVAGQSGEPPDSRAPVVSS